jgi:ankyrin repeat protein
MLLHTSAAHANSAEIVPLLIAAGGNIEKADKWGRTPPLVQALAGRIGGIKALLAAGARIDVRNEHQATAIHLAASNGHVSALAGAVMLRGLLPKIVFVRFQSESSTHLK